MDDIEAAAMRIHHGASWSDLGAEAWTDVLDALVSAELLTLEGMRHLQFTVNTIVFALTQEGGVTQQLMARVK